MSGVAFVNGAAIAAAVILGVCAFALFMYATCTDWSSRDKRKLVTFFVIVGVALALLFVVAVGIASGTSAAASRGYS